MQVGSQEVHISLADASARSWDNWAAGLAGGCGAASGCLKGGSREWRTDYARLGVWRVHVGDGSEMLMGDWIQRLEGASGGSLCSSLGKKTGRKAAAGNLKADLENRGELLMRDWI